MRIKEGKFSVYEIDPMYLEYLSKYDKNVRKKSNRKYYGILMRRINIDSGIYLFKTVNLIEGNILENSFEPQEFGISDLELSDVPIQKFFVDSIGSSYPFAEDVDAIDDIDNDLFVSFEISESDLKNKYSEY